MPDAGRAIRVTQSGAHNIGVTQSGAHDTWCYTERGTWHYAPHWVSYDTPPQYLFPLTGVDYLRIQYYEVFDQVAASPALFLCASPGQEDVIAKDVFTDQKFRLLGCFTDEVSTSTNHIKR